MTLPTNQDDSQLLKIENLAKKSLKIFSETTNQLVPNFGGMVFRWCPLRIVSDDPVYQDGCHQQHSFNIGPYGENV